MIDYLKKYSLPFGLKKTTKLSASRRPSLSYADANKILLFFSSEGNQKMALIRSYINKFKKDGKTVKCFYFVLKDEDKPDVGLDDGMEKLRVEEFAFFGKIESDKVKGLLNEDFDFMIHADVESNIYTDIIMAKAKSKCRVGNYFEDKESLYEMMISMPNEKTTSVLMGQIYHYIKRL